MGQILNSMGRQDDALRTAREALRHNPSHRGAKELIEGLEK
jgi:hypothetical protein